LQLGGRRGFTLPPKPGPLQIHYSLPQLASPEQMRFRYRLTGSGEDNWISAGTQRTATFTHLPPGDYCFEVAAAEAGGPWLSPPASLAFTVRAAWWQTIAFRVSTIIAAFLALAWLAREIELCRVRARMRKLKLEQEHALERERTRIARDMHDDVGASLTQITIVSQLAKLDPPEAASGHIDEISAIARRTVTTLDEIVWAVNPRNDTLPALIEYISQHAVDFLTAAGIVCELDIPEELPPHPLDSNVRRHLFLVAKETLNNVVKHAGAHTVRLKVELMGKVMRIVIADDGRGFEAGAVCAGSDGLHNMRERMKEVGGDCRIESRPGEGTRVVFELPLPDGGA
jgi:signal transduction histidine kinase